MEILHTTLWSITLTTGCSLLYLIKYRTENNVRQV